MPEKPNQTQMLGAILATTRIIEAEAILRFNASPTLEMADHILTSLTMASKEMRPREFVPFPCWGVHITSMCWPKPLVEGVLQPFLQEIQAGHVIGPDGKPFPLLK